jgi:hypothetical protein
MKKAIGNNGERQALGRLSRDTHGPGGVILESFTYMPKTGITA